MKKVVLLMALVLSSTVAFAQKVNKAEVRQLQAFLSQPAKEAATNAEALRITNVNDPAGWEGVTVENGSVVEIK